MAEMTAEERAVYISHFVEAKNLRNVPAKEAVRQQAIAQINAAVQAERGAIAKAHDQAADVLQRRRLSSGDRPHDRNPKEQWHRDQAAAIRAREGENHDPT